MTVIKTQNFEAHKDELNCFWKDNRECFGMTPERFFPYLQWRFQKNPHNTYTLWLFYHDDILQGHSITRKDRVRKWIFVLNRLAIEDMVARHNDEAVYVEMIAFHRRFLGDCYGMSIRTVNVDNPFFRALQKFRWKVSSSRTRFMFYWNSDSPRPKEWHITEILCEGVNQDEIN